MKKNNVALFLILLFQMSIAHAEDHKTWSAWQDKDYWLTGVTAASTVWMQFGGGPSFAKWQGGILFDDGIRAGLRAPTQGAREGAAVWSDWVRNIAMTTPFVVDAVGVQWLSNGDGRAAIRTSLVALESFSIILFVGEATKRLAARGRPSSIECANDPNYTSGCGTTDQNQSFFSGHASASFVAAGLVCRNHENLELFGGSAWDKVSCITVMSLATSTALLRIVADRHYATDALLGSVLGFASGYYLPMLLHHIEDGDSSKSAVKSVTTPWVTNDALGISHTIQF